MRFIMEPWKGNLSLPKTFWLNGVALSIAFWLLIYATESIIAKWTVPILVAMVICVATWQVIEIWHSSGNYLALNSGSYRGHLARFLAGLWGVIILFLVFFWGSYSGSIS